MKPKIYANVLVSDEENYVKYAIASVIDYVDRVLVIDTSSTDETKDIIISNFKGEKLYFWDVQGRREDGHLLNMYRNAMLHYSIWDGADWMMILDGHEVYYRADIERITNEIIPSGEYDMVAVGYYHLNGKDVIDNVNSYQVGWPWSPEGCGGWRIGRFFNLRTILGIHWDIHREFPRETLVDDTGEEIAGKYKWWVAKDERFVHFNWNRSRNDHLYSLRQQIPVVNGPRFDKEYPEVMR